MCSCHSQTPLPLPSLEAVEWLYSPQAAERLARRQSVPTAFSGAMRESEATGRSNAADQRGRKTVQWLPASGRQCRRSARAPRPRLASFGADRSEKTHLKGLT